MPQLTEIKISIRRGLSNLGESTEAEVSATFKIQKGDGDLTAVVGNKFQEVSTALIEALEAEPRQQTAEKSGLIAEGGVSHNPSLAGWTSIPDEPVAAQVEETQEVLPREMELADANGAQEGAAVPCAEVEPIVVPSTEEQKITDAQKRTIESLRQSIGLDEARLRALLETSFNRKTVQDLAKREAASLILLLSQKQRERIIRDKPEGSLNHQSIQKREEGISRNGSAA